VDISLYVIGGAAFLLLLAIAFLDRNAPGRR
jgi:hypothetical protein